MGLKRTAPASTTVSPTDIPSRIRSSAKSTRMIEFRTTIPAPGMKPIDPVPPSPSAARATVCAACRRIEPDGERAACGDYTYCRTSEIALYQAVPIAA